MDYGKGEPLGNLSSLTEKVLVVASFNLAGYAFPVEITRQHRREVEKVFAKAFSALDGNAQKLFSSLSAFI